MPVLTLKYKNDENKLGEYILNKGETIMIGRLEDNDIVIENLAVSGHHAKIDSVGHKYLIADLNSKNGTFVNDHKISSPHWLNHGDIIIIGKHYLIFNYIPEELQNQDSQKQNQDTVNLSSGDYQKIISRNARKTGGTDSGDEPVGILSFLEGGEGEMELAKKLIKIGKNAASDIIVRGLTMGQTAATISKRPNGYYLSYVGGLSKPRINGKVLKDSVLLNQFDIIEIGSLKMQFIHK